jgi:hypothetical protein
MSESYVKRMQRERDAAVRRAEAAQDALEAALGGDLAWQKRLAEERRDRCRVLWAVLEHYRVAVAEFIAPTATTDCVAAINRAGRVAAVAVEGGPLGHQGEITTEDRPPLADLERILGVVR